MTTIDFQKKPAHRLAVFLCIFCMGSASTSLGWDPAGNVHGEYMKMFFPDTEGCSRPPLFGPPSARSGKFAWFTPDPTPRTATLRASGEVTASWYGPRHHNRLTASGKRFDMYKNTLAHKTLPLGTKVRLVNPANGKYAEGVVNDRGPYIKGRDVDVSYSMARQLGFVRKGVTKLDIEMI